MTPRQQYLRYSGFKYDTFAQPDAEQEYGFADRDTLQIPPFTDQALAPQPDDIPPVFPRAYYVDPRYSDRREGSVFDELRAAEPRPGLWRTGRGQDHPQVSRRDLRPRLSQRHAGGDL